MRHPSRHLAAVTAALLCSAAAFCAEAPPEMPVSAETQTPEAVIKAAKDQIAKLTGDNFDDREGAQRAMEKLDLSLLPWLRKLVDEDKEKKELDAETHNALGRVLAKLEERNDSAVLRTGTAVKVNLSGATRAEILAAIEKQSGIAPIADYEMDKPADTKQDFSFSGTYWDAIASLLKIFPQKAGAHAEREKLTSNFFMRMDPGSLDQHMVDGFLTGHGTAGACLLRVPRCALEQEAPGTFLSFVIVPHLENRYAIQKMLINPGTATLDNGVKLECKRPEQPEMTDNFRTPRFWTVSADITKSLKGATQASLDGTLEMEVCELKWFKENLSKAETFNLPGGTSVSATVSEGKVELRISGTGVQPQRFTQELQTNIKLTNAENTKVNNSTSVTRMSSSGLAWTTSVTLTTTEPPIYVELRLPVSKPRVTVPFKIDGIALPRFDIGEK